VNAAALNKTSSVYVCVSLSLWLFQSGLTYKIARRLNGFLSGLSDVLFQSSALVRDEINPARAA
jgi:hypothetical protein